MAARMPRRDFLKYAGGAILAGAAVPPWRPTARMRGGPPAGWPFDPGTFWNEDNPPGQERDATDWPPDPNTSSEPTDLDRYDFILPRVRFVELPYKGRGKGPDIWNVRPGGDANLLREFANVVRCRVKPIEATIDWQPQYAHAGQLNAVVTFDEPDLFQRCPFLFMTGENQFEFSPEQKQNLKDYLTAGGFLLMDDCVVGSGGDFFYRCAYLLLEELFGSGSVRPIPREHEVFHNVYDLGDTGLPYLQYAQVRGASHGQNHGAHGLFVGDRLAVFLSSNDLHCGWCDGHGTVWGLAGYRQTIQMGINIITYALTH
jgi:hypothetical protein